MDDAEMKALAASHLRALPAETVAGLTERARRRYMRPVTRCTAPGTTSGMSRWWSAGSFGCTPPHLTAGR